MNGTTAMGSAIACSLGVAEQLKGKPSQIIVLTDGRSNVGIGNTEEKKLR